MDCDHPKEAAYDAQIAPLLDRIIDLAKEHKIAMFATFVLDTHDDGPLLCTTSLPNESDDPVGLALIEKLAWLTPRGAPGTFGSVLMTVRSASASTEGAT